MSKNIDLMLSDKEARLGWSTRRGYQTFNLPLTGDAFRVQLATIKAEQALPSEDIIIYIGEDLLFFTKIILPLQTPRLKEAIALQLGILSPYGEEDSLYAYTASRQKDGFHVIIYACRKTPVLAILQEVSELGFFLTGIFPESQRYLNRRNNKDEWGLWNPGPFGKITHFRQGKVVDRHLCSKQINLEQIKESTGLNTIYSLAASPTDDNSVHGLLKQPAVGGQYDMLPANYRRPDYLKKAMLALAVLNTVLLLLFMIGKGVGTYQHSARLDTQIAALTDQAKEANGLKAQERKLKDQLAEFKSMGSNMDLIAFLAKLTKQLPSSAYLDQLRLDKKTGTITLQGYTDDLPGLTAKINDLGSATLKSTLKRRNKTYFHLEVSMP